MADGLLGAYFGNPNVQRQGARARELAKRRDVNLLPDPKTYAVMQGLLGIAPDQMGFSVMNPNYQEIRQAAEPAFYLGSLLQAAPLLAPMTKGLPVGASIKNVSKIDQATGLPLNSDGTVTLFHHTNKTAAEQISKTGKLKSAGEPSVYLTTQKTPDTGYGDVVVPIRIKPSLLNLDDEFPNGRMDFSIDTGKPKGSIPVVVEKQAFEYPQEEAMRLAQQRAALPVEQGGLGLPVNNTAMDRANSMGFRTKDKMYHGTQEENISRFVPTPHDESGILGTSLARSPRVANFYAGGRESMPSVENAGNIMPVFVQGKKPQNFEKFVDYQIDNDLLKMGGSNIEDTRNAIDYLEKKNLAGFDYKNLYGDEVQVVNPDRIRSVFAAFDPFRKTAAIAAAMGVAAPDLLAQEVDYTLLPPEKKKELLQSLLGK